MSGLRRLERIADGFFVATSSRYTTTTTVVAHGGQAFVIDPAWTPGELDDLVADLAVLELTVTAGFATHAHQDHVLWHPGLGDVPRWASATTVAMTEQWRSELMEALGDDLTPPLAAVFGDVTAVDGDLQHAGRPIRMIAHDGHAPGHTALLVDGVLIAGDMLSDIELPLPFMPDDLPAYLDALDLLAPAVAAARLLIPGHGHVTGSPMDRLDADRFYLDSVMRGVDAHDARRTLPGMDEAHQRIVSLARELS